MNLSNLQGKGKFPRWYGYLTNVKEEIYAHTDGELISALYKARYDMSGAKNIRLVNNVSEITGYKRVGEKAMVRFIKNKKSPIISPSSNINNVTRWILKIKTPQATVNIFKSGAIQIATAAPIERVAKFVDEHYLPGFAEVPIETVKIDGQFFINFNIDLEVLGHLLYKYLPKGTVSYSYEPELHPAGFLKYGGFKYMIYQKGQILFQGSDADTVEKAPKVFGEIFKKYKIPISYTNKNEEVPLKVGGAGLRSPQRAKVNKKQQVLERRYVIASGYNNKKEGFYVRPGPNGKPRFYPEPENSRAAAVLRMKVLRAYTNAGVNIPQSVKNLFNLEGIELKEKVEKKELAPSFNAVKNGFYVKPGKGGLPQFYKMPEHVNKARPGVIEAYRRAGKNIPQTVKNQFKIGNVGMQLPAGHYINKVGNRYRINGAFADEYTDAQLMAIARNLKIPQASSALKKGSVIRLIVNKLGGSPNANGAAHAVINGVPHTLLMNGRVMRGKRAKQWKLLTAAEKNSLGQKILSAANFKAWKEDIKRDQQYEVLLSQVYGKKKTPTPPAPAPAPAQAPVPPVVVPPSPSPNGNFANLINLEMYISNALGNKYENMIRNGNSANLKKLLNALPKGKRGKPLQADVNRVKMAFVKNLKRTRQLNDIKKKYYNKIVVPANMRAVLRGNVNLYKRQLTNIATTLNNKGRFPSQANVKKGIIAWVRSKYPRRLKGGPREVENAVTGEKRMVYPSPPSPNRKTPSVPRVSAKRISPLKVARREPAYKRPRKAKANGPAVGPIKPPPPGARSNNSNSNSNSAPRPKPRGPAVGPVKPPPPGYSSNSGSNNSR
jgi:TATA-box binding protein (TBP) (component of TFIID and TFIIIB)